MVKQIRLSESDLVNLIEKVIQEQANENSQKCEKFEKKRKSYKAKGGSIIRLAPKKAQGILTSIFNTGMEKGPEAFKNAVPQNIKAEFQKKLATLKKPKSERELDAMLLDAENQIENIQEQAGPPQIMGYVFLACILLVLVILIWGMDDAPLCSTYRG